MKLPNLGPNAHWELHRPIFGGEGVVLRLVVTSSGEILNNQRQLPPYALDDYSTGTADILIEEAARAVGVRHIRGSKS